MGQQMPDLIFWGVQWVRVPSRVRQAEGRAWVWARVYIARGYAIAQTYKVVGASSLGQPDIATIYVFRDTPNPHRPSAAKEAEFIFTLGTSKLEFLGVQAWRHMCRSFRYAGVCMEHIPISKAYAAVVECSILSEPFVDPSLLNPHLKVSVVDVNSNKIRKHYEHK